MTRTPPSALLAATVVLFLVGCSVSESDERRPPPDWVDLSRFSPDTSALVGTWTWVRTRCCYGDLEVATPRSTGDTQTLIVTEDGTVKVYRNQRLHERTTLMEYLRRAQWGVRGDTLAVSWAHIDGPESVYTSDG